MDLVDFNRLWEINEEIHLNLTYLELYTLYFLCDKEENKIRLGELLGTIKQQVYVMPINWLSTITFKNRI